ncbi:hypothetical protein C7B77_01670 [Chamaesiphon polymorphus CCALA 037]|uniref:Uncharacterized protein n=2 Tax=Chamaesiphon TaxID=217161 RepID=A0A2T1GMV3_9CYAN|nr:hypothetical protein C7B77_01670 [Chamaesiphon polymorphus CCALA 037]
MTASINPGKTRDVAIKDPQERLFEYIASLVAWLELTKIKKIVFCENTNCQYDFSRIIEFASNQGKTLEVLIFSGNAKAQKYGKGYGEGEIIKYALRHSKYLSNTTNFYKITGRLFVKNFDEIQSYHQHFANVFQYPAFSPEHDPFIGMSPKKSETLVEQFRHIFRFLYVFLGRGKGRGPHDYTKHVVTSFYKSNVNFYRKNLIDSYKRVDEEKSYIIEHVFYEDILYKDFNLFLKPLTIIGRSGSTGGIYIEGENYPEEIEKLAMTFLL